MKSWTLFMKRMWLAVLLASLAVPAAGIPPVSAAYPLLTTAVVSERVRLDGQVASLDPGAGDTVGFTLQTRLRSVYIHIVPSTTFTAYSAEAAVEGLSVGDYALVTARRTKRGLVAERIDFDVDPIPARPDVSERATVIRENSQGTRLIIRLPSGTQRIVTLGINTSYRIAGQTAATPPVLSAGEVLRITMRPARSGWVALQIDVLGSAAVR